MKAGHCASLCWTNRSLGPNALSRGVLLFYHYMGVLIESDNDAPEDNSVRFMWQPTNHMSSLCESTRRLSALMDFE